MRFFNTTGPIQPSRHYCVPPLSRVDLGEIRRLVEQEQYFVLYAPRQTGKTSVLVALRDLLNREGACRCVYVNLEAGQTAGEDVAEGMRTILDVVAHAAELAIGDDLVDRIWPEILRRSGPNAALIRVLGRWAQADPRPLVLFLDEVDALVGDTLVSLLRQLRTG